ncbi:hypothetical protein [Streptomyces brasiliensis]|uniref:Uncharacterized protein n=1 Tax=Streptomyces brasiliensis TaxID=1954 RepID=A0A917L852_9ACTN|nr:hypothetical protein [Streptomyces brasiliensis]GGJ51687.1 hypothetical protein GCM10010121_073220 [Streptomyces brasiliensis]
MSDENTTDNVHATIEPADEVSTDNVHATSEPTDEAVASPANVHATDEKA